MRRIETEEIKIRKKKRNNTIFSLFMLSILLLSTLGFAFSFGNSDGTNVENPENVDPNNPYSQYWTFKYEDKTLYFTGSPEDAKTIEMNIQNTLESYKGKSLYIATDNQEYGAIVSDNMNGYASRIQRACYGECDENLPEKSCNQDNMIVITTDADPRVYQLGTCVFIDGDSTSVDAFLYKTFGII